MQTPFFGANSHTQNHPLYVYMYMCMCMLYPAALKQKMMNDASNY